MCLSASWIPGGLVLLCRFGLLILPRFSSYRRARNFVPKYILIIVLVKLRTPSRVQRCRTIWHYREDPPQPCFGRVRFTVLVSLNETGRLSVTFAFALNNRVGPCKFLLRYQRRALCVRLSDLWIRTRHPRIHLRYFYSTATLGEETSAIRTIGFTSESSASRTERALSSTGFDCSPQAAALRVGRRLL